jgi:hypothetical protein
MPQARSMAIPPKPGGNPQGSGVWRRHVSTASKALLRVPVLDPGPDRRAETSGAGRHQAGVPERSRIVVWEKVTSPGQCMQTGVKIPGQTQYLSGIRDRIPPLPGNRSVGWGLAAAGHLCRSHLPQGSTECGMPVLPDLPRGEGDRRRRGQPRGLPEP